MVLCTSQPHSSMNGSRAAVQAMFRDNHTSWVSGTGASVSGPTSIYILVAGFSVRFFF